MLKVNVQNVESVTVLRCEGRIVAGNESVIFCETTVAHSDADLLVLELGQVHSVDARGLGLLLDLLVWTRSKGVQLKLTNLARRVWQLFKLTRLDRVFTICSIEGLNLPL